jgi:small-conductance mechanosensitive channel
VATPIADLPDLAVLLGCIAIGLLIGWAVTAVVVSQLRSLAKRRGWDLGIVLAAGIGAAPVWWGGIAGGALALEVLAWSARLELYVARALVIVAIVTATVIAARVTAGLVRRSMAAPGGALPSTSIFVNLARIVVVLLGGLLVMNALNISVTPILTALGVGGLAVALALQDTLGNLFAGLQIVASKQIRPGDYLLLEGAQEGTVVDIAWRTTTLRTQAGNLVIVPNSTLGKAIVTNYRLPAEAFSVMIEFGVSYDADLDRVETVTSEVALEVMRELQPSLADPEPVVRFRTFGESHITGVAILRVPEFGDQYPLRSAFIKRLHARFAEEGIRFPYPSRTVHLVQE